MGVTKVLMASNDTLFNFEDTLGDREDLLSPRNVASSGSNTAISITPQPYNCKTPTNEGYLNAYPAEYKPNDTNLNSDNPLTTEHRPNTLQLNLENLTNNLNDLLSPEQQKTFSEEINTIEQLSSDLSATIDATNTLDDLKTCISVHLMDDANNSKMENSEIDAITIDSHQTNSLTANESFDIVEHVTSQLVSPQQQQSSECYPTNATTTTDQTAGEQRLNNKSSEHNKCDITTDLFATENAKENKSPNVVFLNVTKSTEKIHLDLKQLHDQCESPPESEQNDLDHKSPGLELSGEEDPWV